MHKIDIPQFLVQRMQSRLGRLHIFETIVPARTAHLVVDLQNAFMAPGQPVEVPLAREIVPNVNRISAAVRAAGGIVVFLQNTMDAATHDSWSNYLENFLSPERQERFNAAFRPGSFGHSLWPALDVTAADLKVPKYRYSPFVSGSSDLHALLGKRGIDTLIISGTSTNVCCESTARDASMMNYKVIFVADGSATYTDAEHNATLGNLLLFVDVVTTDEVVALLGRHTPR